MLDKHPHCASALNGLGIIATQSGDVTSGRAYFTRAVAADAHFAPAYLNLGRLSLLAKEYAAGETLLRRAESLDPTNAETLSLLAYLQLLGGKLDDSIATVQRAHRGRHDGYSMVHLVAADAYERKRMRPEAAQEYKQYLAESPNGVSAERARSAVNVLQATR